jgi:hypothetical protein
VLSAAGSGLFSFLCFLHLLHVPVPVCLFFPLYSLTPWAFISATK